MTANALPPSSAVPAVGAASKRILGRDTDAYSQAQFAKPGVPKTHWNQDDQAKRASGAQPTKCAAMQMVVSVTDTGLRCYRISITGWKSIVVVHQVDTDAETLLRAVVPTLDTLPTREVVVFEPLCDVTFKPVTQFGRTRLMLLSIAQREAPKKPVESPKETKPVNAEKTSELDEVFSRDANNQPADAKTARNYGRLWQRMNELYSFYAMPDHMDLDQHEHIHVLLGLRRDGSLLDLGAMEDNVIYKNLKTALDVGFKLKTFAATVKAQSDTKAIETHAVDAASVPVANVEAIGVPATPNGATAAHAEPQTGHATAYPNYPQSPIIVYPMAAGSIIYKGIRFSVTYRLGGTWAMATALMDDFAAHREFIDPSCIVRPMQNAQTGGSTAPRDEDAPPDDGDNSEPQFQSGGGEEHENGTAIMRSVEGNKTTYTIWYNAGSTETKYPKKISNPQGIKLLETSLRAAGRNPDKWENGKRYNSVKVNVWWKQGKQIEGTTKHYTDYTRFEVVKEVEEVPA